MNKQVLIVEWIDASVQAGPICEGDIAPECSHISAGYLVNDWDDYLTLGLDYSINEENWRYLLHIPQSQVKKTLTANSWKQVWRLEDMV